MPRKHRTELQSKPQSTAPASFGKTSSLSKHEKHFASSTSTNSVNELISRLRIEQNGHIRPENVFSNSSARSLPPHVRGILSVPIPPPPKPRAGLRSSAHGRIHRTAGPPAPQSWLESSRGSTSDAAIDPHSLQNTIWMIPRLVELCLDTLPGVELPPRRSLQHVILKQMALQWPWHVENDGIYMSELPTAMKEKLLSYVATFAPPLIRDGRIALRLLFPSAKDSDDFFWEPQDEYNDVKRLDLTSFSGHWLSKSALRRELLFTQALSNEKAQHRSTESGAPESWEDAISEGEDIFEMAATLPPELKAPLRLRFPNLAHLSLALQNVGMDGSAWASLLNVTPYLSTLTSLSLANWPSPTFKSAFLDTSKEQRSSKMSVTPVKRAHSSAQDLSVARSVLRKLSSHLYCLKWLDLSDCGSWALALVPETIDSGGRESNEFEQPPGSAIESGPDWNGVWRSIVRLRLLVTWWPEGLRKGGLLGLDESSIRNITRGEPDPALTTPIEPTELSEFFPTEPGPAQAAMSLQASRWAHSRLNGDLFGPPSGHVSLPADSTTQDTISQDWDVEVERARYYQRKELLEYVQELKHMKHVASRVQSLRRDAKGKFIDFDFGDEGGRVLRQ